MEKFVISNGMNVLYSNSRNISKHIQDTGWDKVFVATTTGTPVSKGVRDYDGHISVMTYKHDPDFFEHDAIMEKLCTDMQHDNR